MFQGIMSVPDEPFRLVVVSDLHIGLKNFRKDMWIKQLRELEEDNTYWIVLGDIVEGRTGSDVKMYDPFTTELSLQEQYNYFFDSIEPFKDKCIGMIQGNHEVGHVQRGALNPLEWYCASNKIPYFGDLGRLVMENKNNKCRLLALHGAGGGRQVGTAINRLNSFADSFLPDVVISGHHHKPAHTVGTQPKEMKDGTIKFMRRDEILTGSLMDGYRDGVGSYAERKLLNPYVCSYTVIGFDDALSIDYVKFVTE